MKIYNSRHTINQMHIDIARNATDDFNLFHDPHQWHLIKNNPFNGTIALGFQLESFIENKILQFRQLNNEMDIINDNGLRFSNYQFSFVNIVRPTDSISVDINKSQFKKSGNNNTLTNKVILKAGNDLALIGYKKESEKALYLNDITPSFSDLNTTQDRSYINNQKYFLKRKYMNTSNAKNFLCGSFVDQSLYFDELNDKAIFPEIFPCSLISCALLERALKNHHDFKKNPMVYKSHKISIDLTQLRTLKSNDPLHILIHEVLDQKNIFHCFGIINNSQVLFKAIITLSSLN